MREDAYTGAAKAAQELGLDTYRHPIKHARRGHYMGVVDRFPVELKVFIESRFDRSRFTDTTAHAVGVRIRVTTVGLPEGLCPDHWLSLRPHFRWRRINRRDRQQQSYIRAADMSSLDLYLGPERQEAIRETQWPIRLKDGQTEKQSSGNRSRRHCRRDSRSSPARPRPQSEPWITRVSRYRISAVMGARGHGLLVVLVAPTGRSGSRWRPPSRWPRLRSHGPPYACPSCRGREPEMTVNARSAADALHNSTKHGTAPAQPDRLVRYKRLDPGNAPDSFKRYRDLPIWPIPRGLVSSDPPAVSVLSGDRGGTAPFDSSLLGTLLYLTAGVTRTTAAPGRRRTFFRAAMSAGNLHPVEVYLVAGAAIEGIPAGVHHFAPYEFGLTKLRSGDHRAVLAVTAPAALVFTGLVWRTTWKYGERGWRHLYWDAGTMLANLLAAADAHGLEARVFTGFDDEAVSRLVGIDGVDEVPLAVVTLGDPDDVALPRIVNLEQISHDVDPVAPHPVRLPLLVEAQAGSVLTAAEVDGWRLAASEVSSEASSRTDPPAGYSSAPIEAVILQRGSTRVMRRDSVPGTAMQWPLAASTRTVPLDAAPRGRLLEHYVNVHAVTEVRSGAYLWQGGGAHLVAENDSARAAGARLCLDQPLGGDSAYTVFHHAHLDPILNALGSRGYRAAQLEAGIVSGRLALCAFAIGLGATGLTFFDDLVSAHFQTTSAPMLATSIGVPETPPAPAGLPGEPATLNRYGQLMTQVSLNLQRSRPVREPT